MIGSALMNVLEKNQKQINPGAKVIVNPHSVIGFFSRRIAILNPASRNAPKLMREISPVNNLNVRYNKGIKNSA
jgi:hypothetical protein